MADYQSWPLWKYGGSEVGNVDPETLPLSPQLRDRLKKWAEAFDSRINLDDPENSRPVSDAEVDAFEDEGLRLWQLLNAELHPSYRVSYHSSKDGKVLDPT